MLTAGQFQLSQLQAVVFTPALGLRPSRLLVWLEERGWRDRLDADPTVLELPAEIPAEVPRLILQSRDGQFRLQASAARVDVFWGQQHPGEAIHPGEHLVWANKLFTAYLEATHGVAGRLACVATRFATTEDPGRRLAEHFCKNRWLSTTLNRPADFQLHAHKRFNLTESFVINSWVRCLTGTARVKGSDGEAELPAVLVQQDFNTLPEELDTRDYNEEQREDFFRSSVPALDNLMRQYFPEPQG